MTVYTFQTCVSKLFFKERRYPRKASQDGEAYNGFIFSPKIMATIAITNTRKTLQYYKDN